MRHSILIILLSFTLATYAQNTDRVKIEHINVDGGIAIKGYDPVAYFTAGKPTKGLEKYSLKYKTIVYHFATEENKKAFELNPSKYEPEYGGWCAYAMGDGGKKVEIDPKTFKIIMGRLYLFYNAYFNNTLKSWNKDEDNLKIKADKNWQNLVKN